MCAASGFHRMHQTLSIFSGPATVLNSWQQYLSKPCDRKKQFATSEQSLMAIEPKESDLFLLLLSAVIYVNRVDKKYLLVGMSGYVMDGSMDE